MDEMERIFPLQDESLITSEYNKSVENDDADAESHTSNKDCFSTKDSVLDSALNCVENKENSTHKNSSDKICSSEKDADTRYKSFFLEKLNGFHKTEPLDLDFFSADTVEKIESKNIIKEEQMEPKSDLESTNILSISSGCFIENLEPFEYSNTSSECVDQEINNLPEIINHSSAFEKSIPGIIDVSVFKNNEDIKPIIFPKCEKEKSKSLSVLIDLSGEEIVESTLNDESKQVQETYIKMEDGGQTDIEDSVTDNRKDIVIEYLNKVENLKPTIKVFNKCLFHHENMSSNNDDDDDNNSYHSEGCGNVDTVTSQIGHAFSNSNLKMKILDPVCYVDCNSSKKGVNRKENEVLTQFTNSISEGSYKIHNILNLGLNSLKSENFEKRPSDGHLNNDSFLNTSLGANSIEVINLVNDDDDMVLQISDSDEERPTQISDTKKNSVVENHDFDNSFTEVAYNLIGVSDFSVMSENCNKPEDNLGNEIKKEVIKPLSECDVNDWKEVTCNQNNNYVVRELFATIQNILSGNAVVYKNQAQVENSFWKIENEQNGPIVIIQKRENINSDAVFIMEALPDNTDEQQSQNNRLLLKQQTNEPSMSNNDAVIKKENKLVTPEIKNCVVRLQRLPHNAGMKEKSTGNSGEKIKASAISDTSSVKSKRRNNLFCKICSKKFQSKEHKCPLPECKQFSRRHSFPEKNVKQSNALCEAHIKPNKPSAKNSPKRHHKRKHRKVYCHNCWRKFSNSEKLAIHKCRPNFCKLCKQHCNPPCKHLLDPKKYVTGEQRKVTFSNSESVSLFKAKSNSKPVKRKTRQVAQIARESIKAELLDLDVFSDDELDMSHKKQKVADSSRIKQKKGSKPQNKSTQSQVMTVSGTLVCELCNVKFPNKTTLIKHKKRNRCPKYVPSNIIKKEFIDSDDSDTSVIVSNGVQEGQRQCSTLKDLGKISNGSQFIGESGSTSSQRSKPKHLTPPRIPFFPPYGPSMTAGGFFLDDKPLAQYTFPFQLGAELKRGVLNQMYSSFRDTNKFSCPNCFKICTSFEHFKSHVQKHLIENVYECPYCQKNFPSKVTLNRHTQAHMKNKGFSCKECGIQFLTHKLLYKHILKH